MSARAAFRSAVGNSRSSRGNPLRRRTSSPSRTFVTSSNFVFSPAADSPGASRPGPSVNRGGSRPSLFNSSSLIDRLRRDATSFIVGVGTSCGTMPASSCSNSEMPCRTAAAARRACSRAICGRASADRTIVSSRPASVSTMPVTRRPSELACTFTDTSFIAGLPSAVNRTTPSKVPNGPLDSPGSSRRNIVFALLAGTSMPDRASASGRSTSRIRSTPRVWPDASFNVLWASRTFESCSSGFSIVTP